MKELKGRLTSFDATFLYLEKKECPLHIGSTSLFDSRISLDELVKHVADRLHLIPRYRQRIVNDPFGIAHPTWEFDTGFDILDHIFEIPGPGTRTPDGLAELAGDKFTSLLDRKKPLWELYLVNDMAKGGSALIAKVHHCMVDGISGVDLLEILFDVTPDAAPPANAGETVEEEVEADPVLRLMDSLLGSLEEGAQRFFEMQTGILYLASGLMKPKGGEELRELAEVLPAVSTPAPVLPFNGSCSGERRLAWSEFSFTDARRIKNELEGTVNDLVLTVLSEAVSRYVESKGEETKKKLVRFMMPVSLRQKEQRGSLGNMISIIPVEIPLEMDDLRTRFRFVNQKTATMKKTRLAEGLLTAGAMYALLPASFQAAIGGAADVPFPPFNMVATNVPGPQIPMYLAGRKMVASYPYVPVGYGLGLGCAIFSYDRTLYFGLSSDAGAMPDVEEFKSILDRVFDEIREECLGKDGQERKKAGSAPAGK